MTLSKVDLSGHFFFFGLACSLQVCSGINCFIASGANSSKLGQFDEVLYDGHVHWNLFCGSIGIIDEIRPRCWPPS